MTTENNVSGGNSNIRNPVIQFVFLKHRKTLESDSIVPLSEWKESPAHIYHAHCVVNQQQPYITSSQIKGGVMSYPARNNMLATRYMMGEHHTYYITRTWSKWNEHNTTETIQQPL